MRKQDRIANQQKQCQPQDDRTQSQPAQEDREQLRGSDSERTDRPGIGRKSAAAEVWETPASRLTR